MVHVFEGQAGDLPAVNELRMRLEWSDASWFMGPAFETGGVLFLAKDGDEPVGCGSAVVGGELGFIGSMIVVPERQRQGIGREVFRSLMEWLSAHGATRVELAATEEGRPLYETFGFTARWQGTSAYFEGPFPAGAILPPADGADWDGIAMLDTRASGGARVAFLSGLAADPRTTTAVFHRDGEVRGFGMSATGRIGPVTATDDEAAAAVVRSLLATTDSPNLRLSCGGPDSVAFWKAMGFELHEADARMTWGSPPNDEPALSYALIHGAVG